jgi:hypothetical protein
MLFSLQKTPFALSLSKGFAYEKALRQAQGERD